MINTTWQNFDPPLIMSFRRFASGKYPDTNHSLYIVWRGKQALYIGISKNNIWNRWFDRDNCHIAINGANKWDARYSSPIGRLIINHLPSSLRWKMELRDYDDPAREEKNLIRELHPLCNDIYRSSLTEKERKLYKRLLGEQQDLTSAPCDVIHMHLIY